MLKVSIQSHKYRSNKYESLKNINFSVNNGQLVAIIGPSGIGKSTLIKCLLGELSYKGSVDTQDEKIVYVSQEKNLNPKETVKNTLVYTYLIENLSVSFKEAQEKVLESLKRIGITTDLFDRTIEKLSGGQYRRIQLATALQMESNILLFDEIDTGLDAGCSNRIINEIRDISHNSKKAILFITHAVYKENLELFDKLIILGKNQNGTASIIYQGTAKNRSIEKFFGCKNMIEVMQKLEDMDSEKWQKEHEKGEHNEEVIDLFAAKRRHYA